LFLCSSLRSDQFDTTKIDNTPVTIIRPSHRSFDNSPRSDGQPNPSAAAARTMSNTGPPPLGLDEIEETVTPRADALASDQGKSAATATAAAPPHKIHPLADMRTGISGFGRG
jgi:hypothetical protein